MAAAVLALVQTIGVALVALVVIAPPILNEDP